jgi:hypothetical protein
MKTNRHLLLNLTGVAMIAIIGAAGAASAQFPSPSEALKKIKLGKQKSRPEPQQTVNAPSTTANPNPATSGSMHQAHMGEIVFTHNELDRDQMTEEALVNSFNLGDPIFFRVYMREPAVVHLQPKLPGKNAYWIATATRYKARFTVGGNVVDTNFRIWGKAGDHETWTTWRGELLSRAEKFQPGTEIFREFLSRATQRGLMGVGTHKIKLEFIPYAINVAGNVNYNGSSNEPPVAVGDVIAAGEFTLTVKADSYSKSDPKICAPASANPNPALEQQILGRAKAMWTRPEAPPVRVALTYGGWIFNRHPISGSILDRNIDTQILSRGKDYCDYQSYKYIQPNVGGFSVANSSFESEPHNWYMPCSCLN